MSTIITSEVTVRCDNPKCGAEINWKQGPQSTEETIPEAFFRLLKLTRAHRDPDNKEPKELVFCSAPCLVKWLQSEYVPSLSPREYTKRKTDELNKLQKEAQAQNEKGAEPENKQEEADAKSTDKKKVLPFPVGRSVSGSGNVQPGRPATAPQTVSPTCASPSTLIEGAPSEDKTSG